MDGKTSLIHFWLKLAGNLGNKNLYKATESTQIIYNTSVPVYSHVGTLCGLFQVLAQNKNYNLWEKLLSNHADFKMNITKASYIENTTKICASIFSLCFLFAAIGWLGGGYSKCIFCLIL